MERHTKITSSPVTPYSVLDIGHWWLRYSRCQRCLSRLVLRSAETPLVKGTVIFTWKIFVGWRHHLNFNKNWYLYSWMYELQNGIQFETIRTSNAAKGDFKNSDYPSIYIAVLLGVHVFDCDVTGVPCEGAVCECDHYLLFGILLCQCTKTYMHLWNWKQPSLTIFSQFLTRCLNWLSFHKTIKYSNSRHPFWKISHSLPIAHVK